ncbi:hypothetical protein SS50377_23861 [Spironucleus salmonicida]|uniref:Uncharacterized protein n=1 Tax=Spironucleus salmonicida TaxID=348837 RepID=V6LHX5_9EUKA|nr:hypothetical protein SS50377_23852 [Spironucleus salmonicida]KAH0573926.1 hypothetical protein SS50377_23861 [Spironucleus salmonicida]|eukprot:EST44152.1 Hypothetical protein SS50377_16056 [Spironucleus salmonicida]
MKARKLRYYSTYPDLFKLKGATATYAIPERDRYFVEKIQCKAADLLGELNNTISRKHAETTPVCSGVSIVGDDPWYDLCGFSFQDVAY